MAEGDVVAWDPGKLAEDRLSVPRNGLRTDPIGVESKARIACEDRRCFSEKALNGRVLHLEGAIWTPDDLLFRPSGVEHERARGRGPHRDAGGVENSPQCDIDRLRLEKK
jgi:hypothetical protein